MAILSEKRKKILLKKNIRKYFFLGFFPLFFLIIFFIYVLNSNFLKIKQLEIVGNNFVNEIEIKKIVLKQVQNKYLFLINKNNILIYPEQKIKKEILKNIPYIQQVKISRINFLDGLKIKIIERNPEYLFCLKNNYCFFLEKEGYIYSLFNQKKTNIKKEDFIRFYGNLINNRFFLIKEEMNQINWLIKNIKNKNLEINSIKKTDHLFVIKIEGNTKIIFLKNQNIKDVFNIFSQILKQEDFKINKENHKFKKDIAYINLSFGNKVFYCFFGDVCDVNFKYLNY